MFAVHIRHAVSLFTYIFFNNSKMSTLFEKLLSNTLVYSSFLQHAPIIRERLSSNGLDD